MPVMSEFVGEVIDIRLLLKKLNDIAPQYNWCIRDSEYDGLYIKGNISTLDKIRLVEEGEK